MREIDRRLKALEAQVTPHLVGRHIVVDLVAESLRGELTAMEQRRRIEEARRQARPQDLVIVINCRPRSEVQDGL